MTGRTLSHYQLLEKLGEGGMGVVYRARDTRLGREVAIKVLPEAIARNSERLARFEREARVLASLNHANIASIYEFGQAGGVTFLVLELVPGHILGGPVELPEALRLAVQIATALEAAHDKGIVHRDLKPSNIKVTPEGRVKVLDFGLAKVFSTESGQEVISHSPTLTAGMTKDGVLLGTAAYMSPEQARGKALDHRSDVWAFGCVLFEMLVGRPAFGAESISDTLVAVLKGEPDWSRLPPGTPPAVLRVLRRSLRKDPGRRLHSMADVRLELEELAESEAPLPAPAPGARSSRAWVLALILLILGAFAGGA
jgi:serine/threonine protein kinase